MARNDGRAVDQLRDIKITRGWLDHAEGSVLVEFGKTRVLCVASFTPGVPRWLKDSGTGWVTSEYSMLPRATHTRSDRESVKGKLGGRTQEISRLVGRSLRAVVNMKELGENTIVIVPGANSYVVAASFTLPSASVVLAQLEIPLTTVMYVFTQARHSEAITVLNPAPAAQLSDTLLAMCDIVVPNETESEALGGTAHLLHAGAITVITTLGARGAEITNANSTVSITPTQVRTIDTVGAGDAFVGALCAELSRGQEIQLAAQTASIAGALATTIRGAVPSLPTRDAVTQNQAI